MKKAELDKRLKNSLEELAKETSNAIVNEKVVNFLDFCSKFHKYSTHNLWSIYTHKPDATLVAGMKKWNALGRWVSGGKGCGIPIYAPLITTKTNDEGEEEKTIGGFKIVYVYDVSDTSGDPLPEEPSWKSPERSESLSKALKEFCNSKGIELEITMLAGDIQGVSKKGKIMLSTDAGTKTLIHEIAHELLHTSDCNLPRKVKELEAESVAYIVAKHFGIGGLESPNYIALHENNPDAIMEQMDRIIAPAMAIIEFVEGRYGETIDKLAKEKARQLNPA